MEEEEEVSVDDEEEEDEPASRTSPQRRASMSSKNTNTYISFPCIEAVRSYHCFLYPYHKYCIYVPLITCQQFKSFIIETQRLSRLLVKLAYFIPEWLDKDELQYKNLKHLLASKCFGSDALTHALILYSWGGERMEEASRCSQILARRPASGSWGSSVVYNLSRMHTHVWNTCTVVHGGATKSWCYSHNRLCRKARIYIPKNKGGDLTGASEEVGITPIDFILFHNSPSYSINQ